MDLNKLRKQLEIDEGYKDYIYSDLDGKPTWPGRKIIVNGKLVPDGNPTMGIGHLILKSDPEYLMFLNTPEGGKTKVSKDQIEKYYIKDRDIALITCKRCVPDFHSYDEEPKQIIANMAFNLGEPRLRGFSQFLKDIIAKNFKMAAKEMQYKNGRKPQIGLSDWYSETKDRAVRLVARMENYADDYLCKVNIS